MKRVSGPSAHQSGHGAPASRPGGAHSSRGERHEPKAAGASVRKKVRGPGKELLVCFGVIAVLALAALLLNKQRTQEKLEAEEHKEAQEKIFKLNLERGFTTYRRAEAVGLNYVGTGEKTEDAQLFGPFKNDDRVYNVIYERTYKAEKRNALGEIVGESEKKAMYPGRNPSVEIGNFSGKDAGVTCCYGLAENKTIPLVVARKTIPPKEGDAVNLGGTITVLVKADDDDRFEGVRHPKAEKNR
ncbi:MAG: hypothetical protein ABSE73_15260 [Planctomycetota bacterium]